MRNVSPGRTGHQRVYPPNGQHRPAENFVLASIELMYEEGREEKRRLTHHYHLRFGLSFRHVTLSAQRDTLVHITLRATGWV